MRLEELRRVKGRTPFQPFEITLENGESYVVRHPEQLLLTVVLIFWGQGRTWALFSPDEVTSLRSVNGKNGGSGHRPRRTR